MSSSNKLKQSNKDEIKQQEITQAVIIADNFNKNFLPLSLTKPAVLFPVVNQVLLVYVLNALEKSGIQETFIFCCSHNKQIRNFINSSKWTNSMSSMAVSVISSASFISMGDVLRELDSKAFIRSDFVLINGDVITTFPLANILEKHKKQRQADKGCAITLIYRKALPTHKTRCKEDDILIAVQSATQKIRYYQRINKLKTLHMPLEIFQENEEVTIHYDLMDSHISICSPCVPPLFSDNFDYQTLDDFIKGLLVNEELLGNSMYIHVAEKGYGAGVSNFYMYDAISQDIIGRWAYPLVPDLYNITDLKYSHYRHNIYKEGNIELGRNCILQQNIVIGNKTQIGDNSFITNSVIGRNCSIGRNVIIKGAYLWDNVKIADNCILESCLLGENVELHESVIIRDGCILDKDVIIGPNITLPALSKFQAHKMVDDHSFDEDEELIEQTITKDEICNKSLVGENGYGFLCILSEESDDDDDDNIKDIWGKPDDKNIYNYDTEETSSSARVSINDELSGDSNVSEDEDDDPLLFYNEVIDSLQRGIEEKVKCENIILEINSSKYAYNVTMKEVNTLLIKALLKMSLQNKSDDLSAQQYLIDVKKNLIYFLPLILNYIRSKESQLDCLSSLEEFMMTNEKFSSAAVKILHFFYDKDILTEAVILKWYQNLPPESAKIKTQVSVFIKWLQEADEESSED